MKVISTPSVYLIGKQILDQDQLQKFLDDVNASEWTTEGTHAGEILVEIGARNCYQSWHGGRKHADHLRHLLEVGHGSCAEHCVFTLLIAGVSRSLTHELVRHRAGMSYSQLSQRYVDESVAEYVWPDIIAQDPELHDLWLKTIETMHTAYIQLADKLNEKLTSKRGLCNNPNCWKGWKKDKLLEGIYTACTTCKLAHNDAWYPAVLGRFLPDKRSTTCRKVARQAARSVLPNATETKITVTANARALRHAAESRCSRHADPEIRKLFGAIWEIMVKEAPNLFGDYRKVSLPDGTFEIETDYKKV